MLNFLQRYENIYKVQNLQGIIDEFVRIFLKIGLCGLWTTDQIDHLTNPYNKTHTRTCGCVFFKSRWSIGQFWSMRHWRYKSTITTTCIVNNIPRKSYAERSFEPLGEIRTSLRGSVLFPLSAPGSSYLTCVRTIASRTIWAQVVDNKCCYCCWYTSSV